MMETHNSKLAKTLKVQPDFYVIKNRHYYLIRPLCNQNAKFVG